MIPFESALRFQRHDSHKISRCRKPTRYIRSHRLLIKNFTFSALTPIDNHVFRSDDYVSEIAGFRESVVQRGDNVELRHAPETRTVQGVPLWIDTQNAVQLLVLVRRQRIQTLLETRLQTTQSVYTRLPLESDINRLKCYR